MVAAIVLGNIRNAGFVPLKAAGFTDIAGHWAEAVILRLADNGLISGYGDGRVEPDETLTRAQIAALLDNVMGYAEKSDESFTDLGDWYDDIMRKAFAAGIVEVDEDGRLHPEERISRGEMLMMAAKAFGIKPSAGDTGFLDDEEIPQKYKGYIKALSERGYVSGNPNEDGLEGFGIRAADTQTRAEAFALINNFVHIFVKGQDNVILGEHTVYGNVVISSKSVSVRGGSIMGDVYITAGAAGGLVNFHNVSIHGTLYIFGAAEVDVFHSLVDAVSMAAGGTLTSYGGVTVGTVNIPNGTPRDGCVFQLGGFFNDVVIRTYEDMFGREGGSPAKLTLDHADIKTMTFNSPMDVSGRGNVTSFEGDTLKDGFTAPVITPPINPLNLTDKRITDERLAEMVTSGEISAETVSLYLCGNYITDLSPLSGLKELRILMADNNRISDLTPLAELTNLQYLYMNNNRISDLTPLGGLANLYTLALYSNLITDLTPLYGLSGLNNVLLQGNVNISHQQADGLRGALPDCNVYFPQLSESAAMLFGLQVGMRGIAGAFGDAKRLIVGTGGSWFIYYSGDYQDFTMVRFEDGLISYIYTMSPNWRQKINFGDPESNQITIFTVGDGFEYAVGIGTSKPEDNSANLERLIFELTNAYRVLNGQPSLTWDGALGATARAHSADMLLNGIYSHIGSDGSTPPERAAAAGYEGGFVGANIYAGNYFAPFIMNEWINSRENRDLILIGEFKNLGVGCANFHMAENGYFVTQKFGG
jgi:uncharacterized protein YkwD